MKLIDMKLPKKELQKNAEVPVASEDIERYPYGLRINLEKEQVDKLRGLIGLQAGDPVIVEGKGYIKEVRISDTQDGRKRHNVEIQLTAIGIDSAKKKRLQDMTMEEYAKARGKKL